MQLKVFLKSLYMDLNLDNYDTDEILALLHIPPEEKYSPEIIKKSLLKKIATIKNIDGKLPLRKEDLIDFFVNAFFKVTKNLKIPKPPFEKTESSDELHTDVSFIRKHIHDNPVPTWNSSFKAGKINPLKRKSVNKILNINTRFRDNYNKTKSTDFIYTLPYSVKKVVSMKLLTMEFPKTIYYFSDCLKSNFFYVRREEEEAIPIIIDNGSYDINTLLEEINSKLVKAMIPLVFFYIESNNKVKITHIPSSSIEKYTFFFEEVKPVCKAKRYFRVDKTGPGPYIVHGETRKTVAGRVVIDDVPATNRSASQNTSKKKAKENTCESTKARNFLPGTLGWMLGFRKSMYIIETELISECSVDLFGTGYFLLSVNDFLHNHGDTFISAFEKNKLIDNNVLAKIVRNDLKYIHIKREYFGPVTVNKLNIKIYDEYGRIIDIDNSDYSFSLELELLYDL